MKTGSGGGQYRNGRRKGMEIGRPTFVRSLARGSRVWEKKKGMISFSISWAEEDEVGEFGVWYFKKLWVGGRSRASSSASLKRICKSLVTMSFLLLLQTDVLQFFI